jgi:hypothetical protein
MRPEYPYPIEAFSRPQYPYPLEAFGGGYTYPPLFPPWC